MCLALPARIVSLKDESTALVELGGVAKEIDVSLVEDCAVGDYVIVHVGYALSKVDPDEAERTLKLFAEAQPA